MNGLAPAQGQSFNLWHHNCLVWLQRPCPLSESAWSPKTLGCKHHARKLAVLCLYAHKLARSLESFLGRSSSPPLAFLLGRPSPLPPSRCMLLLASLFWQCLQDLQQQFPRHFVLDLVLRRSLYRLGCLASDGAVVAPPACPFVGESRLGRAVSCLLRIQFMHMPMPLLPFGTHP